MVYKIDYVDGDVLTWSVTETGVECEVDESYTPTIYVSVHGDGDFSTARAALRDHPAVVRVAVVDERVSFRHDPEQVLRVDVVDLKAVNSVAQMVSKWGSPGEYRCYNVDFSREFRYCLEEGIDPLPTHELSQMQIAVPETELVSERVTELTIDDETVTGSGADVLATLSAHVERADPDVLFLNTSDLIPVLFQQADRLDVEFQLGRRAGWQQLAGESTYESYGQVGHSPARYNLPGRVIIDGSNTFMWNQTNLDGCLYLVAQSGKPLQELAWSSIGTILTGIQIQEARERDVLVPWHSWRHEKFKTMRQLHDADRGGFTFAPDVGLHEDVHELDFSSLYPNIIVTRNVSPEKIRCKCHAGREDVPGIGYSICDERGYLPDVLEPLIEDRDAIKAEIRETEDEERREELEGQSSAIKWILVSCFGYQGFSNAKFGRIECHEAINAYAREILLETKAVLEEHGWRIVHGIVDSVWVTPIGGAEQTSLSELVSKISEEVAIRLEHEAHYDWISFVPLRDSDAGALIKYFGKVAGEDEYKYRGIECRQRSTPSYIDDAQKALIRPVDPNELVITNRVSKQREDYTQSTRSVAALKRAADLGLARAPSQSVSSVVVDDGKRSRERVLLASEELNEYDIGFYRELLIRAAASVLSPLGWREKRIEQFLSSHDEISLKSFL
ncbi:type B DNA-directed DNA polymerase [Haladaptatus sp. CMAA 1911]|uniref:type B DNA-directed DNA polymerase n=1 Tax=unclassified Haladaptatus TaxID=2622732 RepID=UPI00375485FC